MFYHNLAMRKDKNVTVPKVEEWFDGTQQTLDNGLVIWAKGDQRAKVYAIRLGVHAGTVEDPPESAGLAHAFEHIVFRGAGRFTSTVEITDPLEQYHGKFNAHTGPCCTTFEFDSDPATIEHVLEVAQAFMTAPHYHGIELERQTILREFRRKMSNPEARAIIESTARFFPNFAWGHCGVGTETSINSMESGQLERFFSTWYRPSNIVAVIVGPDAETQLIERLSNALHGIVEPAHPMPPYIPQPSPPKGSRAGLHWHLPATVAVCQARFPATQRNRQLASRIRAMLNSGMTSPLVRCLRVERGYFYACGLWTIDLRDFDTLYFVASISRERVKPFWSDFWHTFANGCHDKDRLAWTGHRLVAKYSHMQFVPGAIADRALDSLIAYGRVTPRNDELLDLLSISLPDIIEFTERHLLREHFLQFTCAS